MPTGFNEKCPNQKIFHWKFLFTGYLINHSRQSFILSRIFVPSSFVIQFKCSLGFIWIILRQEGIVGSNLVMEVRPHPSLDRKRCTLTWNKPSLTKLLWQICLPTDQKVLLNSAAMLSFNLKKILISLSSSETIKT